MSTPKPSETQRVATEVARRVRRMRPGDEVGSIRAIAAEFEVSADVARKALDLLIRNGLVRAEARRHVVADADAPLDLAETVAEHERRLSAVEAQLAELLRRSPPD